MAVKRPRGVKVAVKIERNTRGKTVMPTHVELPPLLATEDRASTEEHQSVRIELLMLKGVRSKTTLMQLVGVTDKRVMARLIARVHARWETYGSVNEVRQLRGEGLSRLDLIENDLWLAVQNSEDQKIKQVALRSLLEASKQRSELLGLTARRIDLLLNQLSVSDGGGQFSYHARLIDVARRMSEIVAARMEGTVIEGNADQAPAQLADEAV